MSTITSQTTMNNKLAAEVREEKDAVGANDLMRIFTSAATLPDLPFPFLSPHYKF